LPSHLSGSPKAKYITSAALLTFWTILRSIVAASGGSQSEKRRKAHPRDDQNAALKLRFTDSGQPSSLSFVTLLAQLAFVASF